jgi:hypothetical protein
MLNNRAKRRVPTCPCVSTNVWRALKASAALPSAAHTFGQCADQFVETHKTGWRNSKHAWQRKQSLTTHAAAIRDLPVDEVNIHTCSSPGGYVSHETTWNGITTGDDNQGNRWSSNRWQGIETTTITPPER